jgi:hypothetical protein
MVLVYTLVLLEAGVTVKEESKQQNRTQNNEFPDTIVQSTFSGTGALLLASFRKEGQTRSKESAMRPTRWKLGR